MDPIQILREAVSIVAIFVGTIIAIRAERRATETHRWAKQDRARDRPDTAEL